MLFFFLKYTTTTEIYTLSLHDALPILTSAWMRSKNSLIRRRAPSLRRFLVGCGRGPFQHRLARRARLVEPPRSEEHTSELQSRLHLVCRLLLEKKNTKPYHLMIYQHSH